MIKKNNDFGLIGLGTMGKSLLLNITDKGYRTVGYDNDSDKVNALADTAIVGAQSLADFTQALAKPRKIMMLLPAGEIIDQVIAQLLPLLEAGDILMDGGNTFFKDTERRQAELKPTGIHYLGIGISGGEAGARNGPSMMPSGDEVAYRQVEPILTAIAAQHDNQPCVAYLGAGGAGHYVKMVHNGIEYAMMQTLAEMYDIMKRGFEMSNQRISEVFTEWNQGRLQSFLVEISPPLLTTKDDDSDSDLIDVILDKGKQKGTGKWTSQNALDVGEPIPMIDWAVMARAISALKSQRLSAATVLKAETDFPKIDVSHDAESLENATYFAFLLSYAQGMALLQSAKNEYGFSYDVAQVASIWRAGCIIRAAMLQTFKTAFTHHPDLANPLLDEHIAEHLNQTEASARQSLIQAIQGGIPTPCLGAAIAYFDSYRSAVLPTNFIQAQRDFFGAHTYERRDKAGVFHTLWRPSK